MNWLLSIVIALLTGACGVGCGFYLGELNVRWYRISSLEGNSGFYCIALALAGGVVGLVTGLVAARLVAAGAQPSFLKGLGAASGAFAVLSALVTALCWFAADVPPTIDGRELDLVVEIRAPRRFTPGFARDDFSSRAYLENGVGKVLNSVELQPAAARREGDRWIIPVSLRLNTRSSGKRFRAYFNKEFDAFFALPLRGCPGAADLAWSPWIEAVENSTGARPSADEAFALRYRVQVDAPPAPQPTQAERDAQVAAERMAELDAVPAAAPIVELLEFTELDRSKTLRAAALKRIQARPHFAAELVALIETADIADVSAALRVIGQLDAFPPELHGAVATGGRRLVEWGSAWTRAQSSPDVVAPDEYALGACSRHWLEAVRVLRTRAGGDFSTEFEAFLQNSREIDRPALREWGGFPAASASTPAA